MPTLTLIFLMVTGTLIAKVASALTPEVPAKWRHAIDLDQGSNFGDYNVIPQELRNAMPIYHVDIPESKMQVFQSQFIDEETLRWTKVACGKQNCIRCYFTQKDNPILLELFKNYRQLQPKSEIQQKFWGVRLNSHSTHFMWDPETEESIYIKLIKQGHEPGTTWLHTVKTAIGVNDYVEKNVGQSDATASFSYFPERFGAHIELAGLQYTFSTRLTQPAKKTFGDGSGLVPAHGFLGSDDLIKAATQRNLTKEAYIEQELMPKFAKFLAQANYIFGIYPEAHAQNLVFKIHPQNGEIEHIFFRDMADTSVDPLVSLAKGHTPQTSSLKGTNASILASNHLAFGSSVNDFAPAHGAGFITAKWPFDSFLDFFGPSRQNYSYFEKFYHLYRSEVEKITDTSLSDLQWSPSWTLEHRLWPIEIFDRIRKRVFSKQIPQLPKTQYEQVPLKEIFKLHMLNSEFAIIDPIYRYSLRSTVLGEAQPEDLVVGMNHDTGVASTIVNKLKPVIFSYDDGKIIAYDKATKEPMAIVYGLNRREKHAVLTARVATTAIEKLLKKCSMR